MTDLKPYWLHFHGGLHLGAHGENLEETQPFIPSDTLFAALLDAWRRLGRDPEDFAVLFNKVPPDPPFLLTSAFLFAGGVRFYPMPVDLLRLFGLDAFQRYGKTLKRIRFFSEGLLIKALNRERLDGDLFPASEEVEPETGVALQGGTLWLSADEILQLPKAMQRPVGKRRALRHLTVFSTGRVPRVTISRIESTSTIFHAGRVAFAPDCGLWFGVQWLRPDAPLSQAGKLTYRQAFENALAVLQDDGLGGERAAGYGAFTFREERVVSLPDPFPGQPALLLSRYHPRLEELPSALASARAAYSLVSVGGWLATPDGAAQRRKRLTLVAEGSLITPLAYPAGDLTDVSPEYDGSPGLPHRVYRAGLALAVGWPDEAKEEARHA